MEIIKRNSRLREVAASFRKRGDSIGFVPTMGQLHDGHLSLIRRAREMSERVVVSLFVNPTQFGRGEDFEGYPRDTHRDLEMVKSEGVSVVFLPETSEIYPIGYATYVEVEGLSSKLCGARRVGHFRGVATVVTKLLCLLQPDFAFFGQKDAQQLVIIRRLVTDLCLPVEVVACPTVREADGLAMSSRNLYLAASDRPAAVSLYRSLQRAASLYESGERGGLVLAEAMREVLRSQPEVQLEYAEVVDVSSLEPVEEVTREVLCAVAARVGRARLIDNMTLGMTRTSGRKSC